MRSKKGDREIEGVKVGERRERERKKHHSYREKMGEEGRGKGEKE